MSDELERRRRQFESSLEELRGSIQEEVGWLPKARRWALPIGLAAAGLVSGIALRRALSKRRRRLV